MTRRLAGAAIALVLITGACATPRLDPEAPAVVADRRAASELEQGVLDRIAPSDAVIARGSADSCAQFQRNWKVKDPYAYECWSGRTAVVAADVVTDGLRQAHDRALAAGCTGSDRSTLAVAIDYWPRFRGRDQGGHRYDARDLPAGRYTCGDDTTVVELQPTSPLASAEDLQRELDLPILLGGTEVTVQDRTTIPADMLRERDEPLLIIATVAHRYATVDW